MHESQWLAERFEADRMRLQSVAYRMLGSPSEAEDAVHEAWLRLSRSGVFTLAGDRIAGIDLVADPAHLEELAVQILDG